MPVIINTSNWQIPYRSTEWQIDIFAIWNSVVVVVGQAMPDTTITMFLDIQ